MPSYFGIGDKARGANKIYLGVNGVAREVKKMYLGVDGKARLVYPNNTWKKYTVGKSYSFSKYYYQYLITNKTLVRGGSISGFNSSNWKLSLGSDYSTTVYSNESSGTSEDSFSSIVTTRIGRLINSDKSIKSNANITGFTRYNVSSGYTFIGNFTNQKAVMFICQSTYNPNKSSYDGNPILDISGSVGSIYQYIVYKLPDANLWYDSVYNLTLNMGKGEYIGTVHTSNKDAYPSDGPSGDYYYVYNNESEVRGSYIEDVYSADPNAYPTNGKHTDGYWYVKQ